MRVIFELVTAGEENSYNYFDRYIFMMHFLMSIISGCLARNLLEKTWLHIYCVFWISGR